MATRYHQGSISLFGVSEHEKVTQIADSTRDAEMAL